MTPRKALRNRMRSELMPFWGLVLGLVTMPRVAFAACPPLAEKIDGPCEKVNSWDDFVELAESSETEVVFCPFNIETENDDPAEIRRPTTKKLICPSGECFIEGGGRHMEVRVPSIIQGFTFKGADEYSVRFFNLNDDDESNYICDSTFKS
eukprot:scaffold123674_cov51-Attheya_sp.AAC.2